MAYVVAFDRLAFQKVKYDAEGNRTIEPDGPEQIVRKGHYVPDWVPNWQLQALQQSGMIVPVADRPEPEPVAEVGPPAPVVVEEDADPVAPKPTDNRGAWEAYATSKTVGMSTEEAAGYENKGLLIEAVNTRLNQR